MNTENLKTEETNGAKPCVVRSLGQPETIGELRELIKDYPDWISFGFRNQPMQTLCEVAYTNITFVCFQ